MPTTRINTKNRIAQVREKRRIDETQAEAADTIKDYVDPLVRRTSQYSPMKRAAPSTSIRPLATPCPPASTPRLLPGWHPTYVPRPPVA